MHHSIRIPQLLILLFINQICAYGHREIGEECEPTKPRRDEDLNRNSQTQYQTIYGSRSGSSYGTQIDANYPGSISGSRIGTSYSSSLGATNLGQRYPIPESRKCRGDRGLYCDEWTRRCKCHELSGAWYNEEFGRCEIPVDNFCTTKKVKDSADGAGIDYEHFCVENAECTCNYNSIDRKYWNKCNEENGLCKCKWGYRVYEDSYRGCWYSSARRNSNVSSVLLFGLFWWWYVV